MKLQVFAFLLGSAMLRGSGQTGRLCPGIAPKRSISDYSGVGLAACPRGQEEWARPPALPIGKAVWAGRQAGLRPDPAGFVYRC